MMENELLLKKDGFVAEIVLNRPAKLNAVTPAMAATLEEICRGIDRDDGVRVVLLRGAGPRAFCAGSDLNALADYPTAWKFRNRLEYSTFVRELRKPVVAALHGWLLGGGAERAPCAGSRVGGRGASQRCPAAPGRAPSAPAATSTRWRTIRRPGSFATAWNIPPSCASCASRWWRRCMAGCSAAAPNWRSRRTSG